MATKTRKTSKKVETKESSKPVAKANRLSTVKNLRNRLPHVNPTSLIIVLVVLGVVLALYLLRDQYLVAIVNNRPITRLAVLEELEKVKRQDVSDVVNTMIDKQLIFAEAKKRNITVSDDEVNKEINKIEANLKQYGQTLDSQLSAYGLTLEGLKENIRLQKYVEKMIGTVNVTDKEVQDYLQKNKDMLPQDQDEAKVKESVKQQLQSQKMEQKYQELITKLRKEADIKRIRTY